MYSTRIEIEDIKSEKSEKFEAYASSFKTDDLYPASYWLATVGKNKNNDFWKEEALRKSASSILNKPININHERNPDDSPKNIIGVNYEHVIAIHPRKQVLGVKCYAVLYNYLYRNATTFNSIKQKIEAGEAKASMECIFTQFDAVDDKGNVKEFEDVIELENSCGPGKKYNRAFVDPIFTSSAFLIEKVPADDDAFIEKLDSFGLKRNLIDPKSVKNLTNQALNSEHWYAHIFYRNKKKGKVADWTKTEIEKIHANLVSEMKERSMKHESALGEIIEKEIVESLNPQTLSHLTKTDLELFHQDLHDTFKAGHKGMSLETLVNAHVFLVSSMKENVIKHENKDELDNYLESKAILGIADKKLESYLESLNDFIYIKDFLSFAGSSIELEEPEDWDVFYKLPYADGSLELKIERQFPAEARNKLEFTSYEPGCNWQHIPAYDLVLKKKELRLADADDHLQSMGFDEIVPVYDLVLQRKKKLEVVEIGDETTFKPWPSRAKAAEIKIQIMKPFKPMKASEPTYHGQEFFSIPDLWKFWAKQFLDPETSEAARHARNKCMVCNQSPEYDILWADGRGRCWFCTRHFRKWLEEGEKEVISVKEVSNCEVTKKRSENTNPNIWKTLKQTLASKEDVECWVACIPKTKDPLWKLQSKLGFEIVDDSSSDGLHLTLAVFKSFDDLEGIREELEKFKSDEIKFIGQKIDIFGKGKNIAVLRGAVEQEIIKLVEKLRKFDSAITDFPFNAHISLGKLEEKRDIPKLDSNFELLLGKPMFMISIGD